METNREKVAAPANFPATARTRAAVEVSGREGRGRWVSTGRGERAPVTLTSLSIHYFCDISVEQTVAGDGHWLPVMHRTCSRPIAGERARWALARASSSDPGAVGHADQATRPTRRKKCLVGQTHYRLCGKYSTRTLEVLVNACQTFAISGQ